MIYLQKEFKMVTWWMMDDSWVWKNDSWVWWCMKDDLYFGQVVVFIKSVGWSFVPIHVDLQLILWNGVLFF